MRYTLCYLFFVLFCGNVMAASGKFSLFLKLKEGREVHVYLPSEYTRLKNKTYPVLYMQDGQNLFDPNRAFLGQTWNAEQSLNRLISQGLIAPVIVVAIDNTKTRTFDYTQDQDPEENQRGGGADLYLNLMMTEIKPRVDASFRTKKERNSTGIMGSSLGGLVSLYAGLNYGQTFGLVGALSPSLWWNEKSILSELLGAPFMPHRVYIDSGTAGGEKPQDVNEATSAFKLRGMVADQDLKTVIQPGALHSEKFWAQRFPLALQFLFPPN